MQKFIIMFLINIHKREATSRRSRLNLTFIQNYLMMKHVHEHIFSQSLLLYNFKGY